MLYCNCHYRYKDQVCELIGYLSETYNGSKRVRIRLQNNSEIICWKKDLEEIPLTESILQSCYKMKTIIRDDEWDVIWNLVGKNNITIGEKQGKFYLIPFKNIETVIEVLPRGLVQGQTITGVTQRCHLTNLSDLERVSQEVISAVRNQKVRL